MLIQDNFFSVACNKLNITVFSNILHSFIVHQFFHQVKKIFFEIFICIFFKIDIHINMSLYPSFFSLFFLFQTMIWNMFYISITNNIGFLSFKLQINFSYLLILIFPGRNSYITIITKLFDGIFSKF